MMRTDLTEEEVDNVVREYKDYLCNLACTDTYVEYHKLKTKLLTDAAVEDMTKMIQGVFLNKNS